MIYSRDLNESILRLGDRSISSKVEMYLIYGAATRKERKKERKKFLGWNHYWLVDRENGLRFVCASCHVPNHCHIVHTCHQCHCASRGIICSKQKTTNAKHNIIPNNKERKAVVRTFPDTTSDESNKRSDTMIKNSEINNLVCGFQVHRRPTLTILSLKHSGYRTTANQQKERHKEAKQSHEKKNPPCLR